MNSSKGYTLVELIIVILLLGIVTVVTIPFLSPGNEKKLAVVTQKLANAIQHARNESIKTRLPHGVMVNPENQRISVYKLTGAGTVTAADIVPNPLTKQPYQFFLHRGPLSGGVHIINQDEPFLYAGAGRRDNLLFDSTGMPMWQANTNTQAYPLLEGTIQLADASYRREITIDFFTGRVTTL